MGYSPWGHKELDMTERLKVFLGAQLVKNLPAVQETWVRSLGWEDPLEKGTTHPLQYSGLGNSMDSPYRCKESDTTERIPLIKCSPA